MSRENYVLFADDGFDALFLVSRNLQRGIKLEFLIPFVLFNEEAALEGSLVTFA